MNKKKSITVILFIHLALMVAEVCVILTYSLVYNMTRNSGASISDMVFPWGNLISPIIPIITTIVAIGVVLMTSTKHTKIKSLAILFGSQLVGFLLSLVISYGISYVVGHLYGSDYLGLYSGVSSVSSLIQKFFSAIGGFLCVFALGRYYDLQDYDELLDD